VFKDDSANTVGNETETDGASAISVVAGVVTAAVLYTIACPPYDWAVAAWLAPGALLAATRRLRPRHAFLAGVVFAIMIGYGITSWAIDATLVYFDLNRAFSVAFAFSIWLLNGGLPYGLLLAAYAFLARRVEQPWRPCLAAWLWVCAELLRAGLLTGMPWELLGHTQHGNLVLIQIADLGGVYAVSFVVAFASVAAVEVAIDVVRARRFDFIAVGHRVVAPVLLVALTLAYGVRARQHFGQPIDPASVSKIAVVQANIPNEFRWKRAAFEQTLATYAQLTASAREHAPDLVVWPENAVNFYIDREPPLKAQLRHVSRIAPNGLLLGGPRLGEKNRAYNSAYLLDAGGDIVGTYDKRHLVPFAEYDPLPWYGGEQSVDPMVFSPGNDERPLEAETFRIGAVICYEVLFPDLVRNQVRRGADILINLTNDSWLDVGTGVAPQQHFSMALFRAVETRRYLVRAAASGISGFISPDGAVYATVPRNTAGISVAAVERRNELTPYTRWGDLWILGAAVAPITGLARRRGTKAI
jgi:apolipoprotein N-acyltransferase